MANDLILIELYEWLASVFSCKIFSAIQAMDHDDLDINEKVMVVRSRHRAASLGMVSERVE